MTRLNSDPTVVRKNSVFNAHTVWSRWKKMFERQTVGGTNTFALLIICPHAAVYLLQKGSEIPVVQETNSKTRASLSLDPKGFCRPTHARKEQGAWEVHKSPRYNLTTPSYHLVNQPKMCAEDFTCLCLASGLHHHIIFNSGACRSPASRWMNWTAM